MPPDAAESLKTQNTSGRCHDSSALCGRKWKIVERRDKNQPITTKNGSVWRVANLSRGNTPPISLQNDFFTGQKDLQITWKTKPYHAVIAYIFWVRSLVYASLLIPCQPLLYFGFRCSLYKKIIKENYFATFCTSNHYCAGQQSTNNIKKFSFTIWRYIFPSNMINFAGAEYILIIIDWYLLCWKQLRFLFEWTKYHGYFYSMEIYLGILSLNLKYFVRLCNYKKSPVYIPQLLGSRCGGRQLGECRAAHKKSVMSTNKASAYASGGMIAPLDAGDFLQDALVAHQRHQLVHLTSS